MLCMKKINKTPLLTLGYFVLLLIPIFFLKIYPYLTTKYPLLGEHMSPQILAKNDIVNSDKRGAHVFDGVISPILLGAHIKDKF